MRKLILSFVLLSTVFSMLMATGMADSRVKRQVENTKPIFRQSFRMPKIISPEPNRAYAISEIDLEVLNGWTGQFDAIKSLVVGYTPEMRPNSFILSFYDDTVQEWYLVDKQEDFYYPNGKPQVSHNSYWDQNEEKWIYAGTIAYDYYPDFRIRQVTQTNIYNPEPVSIAEFFYTPENMIDYVLFTVNQDMSTYVNRTRMFYDASGRVSYSIYQEQDINEQWIDLEKTVITYLPQDDSTYEDFANLYLSYFVWQQELLNPYADAFKLQREDYYFPNGLDWEFGYYRILTTMKQCKYWIMQIGDM
jgi:hypothetical protein